MRHTAPSVLYASWPEPEKPFTDVSLVGLDTDGNLTTTDEPTGSGDDNQHKVALRSIARSAAPGVKIVFSDGSGRSRPSIISALTSRTAPSSEAASWHSSRHSRRPTASSRARPTSCIRGASAKCAACCSIGARQSSRTTAASRSRISNQEIAAAAVRPLCRPLGIFGRSYQPGMGELFRRATPIEFGIGYR